MSRPLVGECICICVCAPNHHISHWCHWYPSRSATARTVAAVARVCSLLTLRCCLQLGLSAVTEDGVSRSGSSAPGSVPMSPSHRFMGNGRSGDISPTRGSTSPTHTRGDVSPASRRDTSPIIHRDWSPKHRIGNSSPPTMPTKLKKRPEIGIDDIYNPLFGNQTYQQMASPTNMSPTMTYQHMLSPKGSKKPQSAIIMSPHGSKVRSPTSNLSKVSSLIDSFVATANESDDPVNAPSRSSLGFRV